MRLSTMIAVSSAAIAVAALVSSPIAARELVIPAFPADAIIRGENIRLRIEPAAESVDVAVLQRGDAIVVSAESTVADGDEFFPVEVVLTGATGWVRALAVDPRSISATVVAPVVVEPVAVVEIVEEPIDEQAAEREARRAARQANVEAVVEPEPESAGEEANGGDPAADREARRAARQADAEPDAGTEAEPEVESALPAELRFNGSEPTVTDSFAVPSGVLTVSGTHEGDGNFSVWALTEDGPIDLLFNVIGPFSGQSALDVDPESRLILEVEANGPWEVVIAPAF